MEIDVEGNVSEGRGWENGYDEGASRGRDVGGFGGAAGVVRRSLRPHQWLPKKWPAHASKRRAVRGAGAAATGAGTTAAAGASVLPLATTGRAMEKSVRAGLGRG